jgi:hypothetical protein
VGQHGTSPRLGKIEVLNSREWRLFPTESGRFSTRPARSGRPAGHIARRIAVNYEKSLTGLGPLRILAF